MHKALLLFCLGINSLTPLFSQDTTLEQIISPKEKIQLISQQFSFAEGPATDAKGNIYFTDQPNNQIWKYNTNGKLSLFMDNAGRANGLYFDRKGNIIACADEHDELWRINTSTKKVQALLSFFNGKKLNGPNDLWVDKSGGIYFTDPYYQRDYWTRKHPDIEKQNVYYLPKEAQQPVIVDSNILKPNGVAGSKDGKTLFVADIQGNKTYRYHIGKNGTLTNKELFIAQGADGITLDNHGNIYLCGKGVTIYNTHGEKTGHIDIPEEWTSNICFGGKGKHTLFITAGKSVYLLQTKVRGIE